MAAASTPIVTGDRYLSCLVAFVDGHLSPLLDSSLTLKLNPSGLHYVQSRLDALRELEGLLAAAPVDYLRAYVSDLGDHRALEQLRRILGLLGSLKLVSVLPCPARDPTPVSLAAFGRLRILELRGCDLSTTEARGLLELRHTLEKLICHNSTDALRHVFASRIVDIKDSPTWNRLEFVSCACNNLILMDESLQLLPVVKTLDLNRNKFAKVANLRKCMKLQYLDLGFNHLRSITCLGEVSCRISKLVLRNNALTSLRGIENLKLVEGLDLSYNIISNFSELEILSSLSCLKSLWLEGNPICCAQWYRAHVFSFFHQPEKLEIDGSGISTRECWKMQSILTKRHKKPAGYGFYLPAKDDAEDGSSTTKRKKKHSRIASIVEEESKPFGSEAFDQDSASCESDLTKKETVNSDGEAEILDLMNRVETMKKERSILWSRDFKEWLDSTSDDVTDGKRHMYFDLDEGKEIRGRQKTSSSYLGESSAGSAEISFVENGSTSIGLSELKIGEQGSKQYESDVSSEKSVVDRQGLAELTIHSEPFAAIENVIGSRSSSLSPGPPPQYRRDILQCRQNMEEELLQLSSESYSLASSDSDSTSSDEDSFRFGKFLPKNNYSDEAFTNGSSSYYSYDISENHNGENKGNQEIFCENIAVMSAGNEETADGHDITLEHRKGKWKPRKRHAGSSLIDVKNSRGLLARS